MIRELTELLNRLVAAVEADDQVLVLKLARRYARLRRQCDSSDR